ncbi:MAG TPA: lysophospholipid acyltransferase family protein [Ktedonobacterales bacterium]|nr:lysophospholipid acyltransferase family protein [Ktedonobacterales bacterium]
MYQLLVRLSRLLIFVTMKRRISGQEQTPSEGGLLIVSNHLGLLDPLVIGTRLPRRLYILAKSEVFSWPVIGWLARKADVIPVRRGQSDREAIRRVLEHLQAGHAVLIFPEGTYPKRHQPRGMLPAQAGAALLAQRSGATILPIGITGSEMVWSPRSLPWGLFRRWPVQVRVGEPYRPGVPASASQKQALALITGEMMQRIAALLPASYRGYYREAASLEVQSMLPAGPLPDLKD